MRKHLVALFSSLMTALLSIAVVSAQTACPSLVNTALTAVDTNCDTLDRNEACYGYDLVNASFVDDVPDDFFTAPSDVTSVLDLEKLTTTPMDETNGTWGVSVMRLQANVPNTLPGQNVTFLLFGDAEVENAVNPDSVFEPVDGTTVTVATGANIRSGPGLNFNVIGGSAPGDELTADGLSVDQAWLRVVYRDRPAWISRLVVSEPPEVADLPVLTPDLRTPMQAVYLRTGVGQPACEESPGDLLVVQGPRGVEIEVSINGANVTIGSTVGFRNIAPDVMEAIVFDGQFTTTNPDDGRTETVTAGQRALFCLDDPDDRGLDGESNDREVTCIRDIEDLDLSPFCGLEETPLPVLNYEIDLPCEDDEEIVTTGAGDPPPTDRCAAFTRLDSGPIEMTLETYRWTEVPGATRYELVFYNYLGQAVDTTYFTSDTSYTINMGQVATGSELQWEVRAYDEDGYICVTDRSPIIYRLPDPNEPPGGYDQPPGPDGRNFVVSFTCTSTNSGVATWSGALPDDTIFFDVASSFGGTGEYIAPSDGSFTTYTVSGPSGSLNISNEGGIDSVYVRTSFDGRNDFLKSCTVDT